MNDGEKMIELGVCGSGFHTLLAVSNTWMNAAVALPPNRKMLVPTAADAKCEIVAIACDAFRGTAGRSVSQIFVLVLYASTTSARGRSGVRCVCVCVCFGVCWSGYRCESDGQGPKKNYRQQSNTPSFGHWLPIGFVPVTIGSPVPSSV